MLNAAEIEAFLAIVQYGSVTRAASNLFISQSALSYRLQLLETHMGIQLINRKRGTRLIELTDQGRAFLPLANQLQTLYKEIDDLKGTQLFHPLTVSVLDSINKYIMPRALEKFWARDLQLSLTIASNRSSSSYASLESGLADMAIVSSPTASKRIDLIPLYSEKLRLICPSGHFRQPVISSSQLQPRLEINAAWSPAFEQWHERHFGSLNVSHYQFDNPDLIKNGVLEHDAWAIVPALMAKNIMAEAPIQIVDLKDGPADRMYFLAFLHGQPPASCLKFLLEDLFSILKEEPDVHLLSFDFSVFDGHSSAP